MSRYLAPLLFATAVNLLAQVVPSPDGVLRVDGVVQIAKPNSDCDRLLLSMPPQIPKQCVTTFQGSATSTDDVPYLKLGPPPLSTYSGTGSLVVYDQEKNGKVITVKPGPEGQIILEDGITMEEAIRAMARIWLMSSSQQADWNRDMQKTLFDQTDQLLALADRQGKMIAEQNKTLAAQNTAIETLKSEVTRTLMQTDKAFEMGFDIAQNCVIAIYKRVDEKNAACIDAKAHLTVKELLQRYEAGRYKMETPKVPKVPKVGPGQPLQ